MRHQRNVRTRSYSRYAMWRARQPIQAVVAFRTPRKRGGPHFATTMHSLRHPQHHLALWEGKSVPPPTSSEHGPKPSHAHTHREAQTHTNLVERWPKPCVVEPPLPSPVSRRPLSLLLVEPLPMAWPAPPGKPPPPGWRFSHRGAETGTTMPLRPLW